MCRGGIALCRQCIRYADFISVSRRLGGERGFRGGADTRIDTEDSMGGGRARRGSLDTRYSGSMGGKEKKKSRPRHENIDSGRMGGGESFRVLDW